jgi:hypothetical protein
MLSAVKIEPQSNLYDFNVEKIINRQQDDFRKEFVCPEESMRYAGALEQLVFSRLRNVKERPTIIEFGSGTGSPVISAIMNSNFMGVVHGWEINPDAAEEADELIERFGLTKQYIIHNMSYFKSRRIPKAEYLIANPPYLPCENGALLTLPELWGGVNGNDVSKKLLSCGYKNVFLEVSSYSNPIDLIVHAMNLGYKLVDFQITQMPFGIYSRQDIVQKRIQEMKSSGKAFFSDNCYLVGSAFFTKSSDENRDLSQDFLACLTSLGR